MWRCKQCAETLSTRYQLLKHYKLKHGHFGQRHTFPCTYYDCPCSFKTWNALKTHLSRCHVEEILGTSAELVTFTCILCPGSVFSSSREYFSHTNNHLKKYETVPCMFQNCSFQTNIYATFKSHKNRKHGTWTVKDLKEEIVKICDISEDRTSEEHCSDLAGTASVLSSPHLINSDTENENLQNIIIEKFASVLLKLEIYSHVPSLAVDEFLEELHFILTSAVLPISKSTAIDIFQKHDLNVDQSVIDELSIAISAHNPLLKAIAKNGQLASAFKRKQFYKEHFKVVEPVEYLLEGRPNNKTFQYVPLIKSLQQLLSRNDVIDKVVDSLTDSSVTQQQYSSFKDGEHYKNNQFFSENI
ncbi:uncharacterized protein LOC131466732 [Solea solea]|uniref:uncharacterized protein LOC131466732 n=1 Tax=Solea solea TaxID=90069 RepID=UPI00272C8CC8|nr:uncharacterized protein LOC131466732 [Solea solea]